MLRQLWMSGILAAFLIFAVKIGIGLGTRLNHPGLSKRGKIFFLAGSIGSYLALFAGMYVLITGLDLTRYLDKIVQVLKYGMMVHVALAAGLFLWGVRLLIQPVQPSGGAPFRASLLLVMPCPVCATVILLNLSLAFSLFPLTPAASTGVLFACFLGLILATVAFVTLLRRQISSMDSFLGISMVLVALYFVLTLLVAPIYPEIKAAFAMAASNTPTGQVETGPLAFLAAAVLVLCGTGFYRSYFRKCD